MIPLTMDRLVGHASFHTLEDYPHKTVTTPGGRLPSEPIRITRVTGIPSSDLESYEAARPPPRPNDCPSSHEE